MFDFSKTLVRCSALYNIMASDRKRTNMELWQDAAAELVKQQIADAKLKKRDGVRAEQIAEKIEKLQLMLPVLEASKDIEEPLSVGCKTYLSSLYAYEKYHKWSASKDKGNKYTDKGKLAEEDGIDLISRLDRVVYSKNEDRIENDFLCGHPDLFDGDNVQNATKIIDVKCPYDIETFFCNLGKPLSLQYYWQIQGYMALTGAQIGEVHFCLVNTPEIILNDEKYRLFKKMNPVTELSPDYVKAEEELINNLTFDDMPIEDRRIKFIVPRNEEDIQKAYKRIIKCREWLFEIEKMHLNGDEMYQQLNIPILETV